MLKKTSLVAFVLAIALPLTAAVPGQVDFQGLLLDAGGQKVNGAVDLDFTLFDAASGGNAVWTESHAAVPVTDGVYGVTLGSITPLTPLVLGNGNLFLEIVVDGETLTPRRPLLAVPYAVRAADADNLGGASGGFFSEIVHDFPFDGAAPPNDHPSEGTGDADLDGVANFIDPDNDQDGLLDAAELAQSSDINLVTPTLVSFSPPEAPFGVPNVITLTGTNFEPGMSVSFGVDDPAPQNVTPTSLQVAIGPQLASTVDVTVTRVNGQSDTAQYTFAARRVFVTNASTAGNFGGIAGGDARCATRASQLGLSGTFLAWLGDSTTSPSQRFLTDGGAYERLDGTKIADSWADLTDGTLDAPMGSGPVWTGVNSNGTASGVHCNGWTSNAGGVNGTRGVASQTDSQWTQVPSPAACSFAMDLYCFEQP